MQAIIDALVLLIFMLASGADEGLSFLAFFIQMAGVLAGL